MSHPIRPGPARPVPRAETGWRKAAASDANSGCVEIAFLADGRVGVRDSKDPGKLALAFTAHEWACFLDGAKAGEFDPPS